MTDNSHKTVLGIDPGSSLSGIAVARMFPQSGEIVDAFAIETKPKISLDQKLVYLYTEVTKALRKYKPEIVGIETVFFFKNKKTAIEVSHGRGVIVLAVAQQMVPIVDITPLQVKMSVCGYGKATKDQVSNMVDTLFGLKDPLKPDDVADAAAIAWCAYQLSTSKLN